MIRAATARSTQPERSTTAKRACDSAPRSNTGAVVATIRMTGIINTLIQKPRVRTFSRYSRAATISAFDASSRMVAADGTHEDLVQRCFAGIEAANRQP